MSQKPSTYPSPNPSSRPSIYCPISKISVELVTDSYPYETTWNIIDIDDNIIFVGDQYNARHTTYLFEDCIEEGSYEFTIYDSYGDGINDDGGVCNSHK